MSITISGLRTRVLLAINEAAGTAWTNAQLDLVINQAQEDVALELISASPTHLVKTQAYTVTTSSTAHALPSDFYLLRRLEATDHYAIPVMSDTEKSWGYGWFIEGSNINIYKVNDTVTMYYNYLPPDLSDASPTSVLPDYCEKAIVMGAALYCKAQDDEFESTQYLAAMYKNAIQNLRGITSRSSLATGHVRNIRGVY